MFAETVRANRRRLGLSQEELAAAAGLGVRTIRKIEANRIGSPRPATVRLLADAFGLTGADRERFCQTAAGEPADQPIRSRVQAPLPVRQLPAPPPMFTGRVRELAVLEQVHDASTVVISAIDGMAGIGKTALAVHAAHRIANRHPDGQLFIDLHGYTQGVPPVEPADALDRMLRTLGVPGTQNPASLDEKAALYRTRIADQRMLIVLDNAATETQVAPLLPGSPGCLVFITSRRRLAGLDHTRTLSLDSLPTPEAVMLFTHTAGEDRLADQPPDLLGEMVEMCGRLPLAIRIAAARLRSHPTWTVAHLVALLRDQRHRLAELEAGQRSVTAALDLSYQHLNAGQQLTYRLLGLHPGSDIEAYATAALLDSTLRHATRMLDQLLDANLLLEPVAGRYRFHDLTRAHAAHTTDHQTEPARDTALDRLLGHYRHTASRAMGAAYPYEREYRPQVPPARTPTPDLTDLNTALEWLDIELPNLMAAAQYATAHGRSEHVVHLSSILHRHLRSRGRYHDAETLHHQALATARTTGDQVGQLDALNGLGHIHRRQGRYELATDRFGQALQLARATGHRIGELTALTGLSEIHWMWGRYEQAADHYRQALQLAPAVGDRRSELNALYGLGNIHRMRGQYEQAADHFGRVLRLARATSHGPGEQAALAGLGNIDRMRGRHEQAADYYQQALQLARAVGDRAGELIALNGLGEVHRLQGRYPQAGDQYQQLLDLAQENGDRNYEFEAWQGLGRLQYATGDPGAAITHHDYALALAGELNQPVDQARAHDGLAHAHHALNQHEQAGSHWQHALNILTRLDIDLTDDQETTVEAIRTHLAGLDQRDGLP